MIRCATTVALFTAATLSLSAAAQGGDVGVAVLPHLDATKDVVIQPTLDRRATTVWYGDDAADLSILVGSWSDATRPLLPGKRWILQDALPLALARGRGSFQLDQLPRGTLLHLQALTVVTAPVQVLDASEIRQVPADADDKTPAVLGALQLDLIERDMDPYEYALVASFEARSDGYALWEAFRERLVDRTRVYLVLKVPGPGEGMRDIVEHHSLTAELGTEPGRAVEVMVAVTDKTAPYSFRSFRAFAVR